MPRVICDNVARRCASCLCRISHYVFFDIDIFIQLLMLLWLVCHMGDWISPYYTLFLMMLLNLVLSRSRCSISHRRFRVCRRIGRRRFAQSRIKHGHRFRKVLCMHKFALVYFCLSLFLRDWLVLRAPCSRHSFMTQIQMSSSLALLIYMVMCWHLSRHCRNRMMHSLNGNGMPQVNQKGTGKGKSDMQGAARFDLQEYLATIRASLPEAARLRTQPTLVRAEWCVDVFYHQHLTA